MEGDLLAGAQKVVAALDGLSGQLLWASPKPFPSGAVQSMGLARVLMSGTGAGARLWSKDLADLYCVAPSTGAFLRRIPLSGLVFSMPDLALQGGSIYAGGMNKFARFDQP